MLKALPHHKARWRVLRGPLFIGGSVGVILLCAGTLGYRVNFSASEPLGLWQVQAPSGPIHRDDFVVFCAPVPWSPFLEKGACPNGAKPFLKAVAGVPGDRVEVTPSGVWIHGNLLQDSAPLPQALHQDIQLPHWDGALVLPRDRYWLYGSGSPQHSFDSRYWGPLPGSQILFIARPVLVWHSHP
jgi:conjugative transfer signal peptidase TraF